MERRKKTEEAKDVRMKFLQDLANHLYLVVITCDEFQLSADHSVNLDLFFSLFDSESISWTQGFESSFFCCGRILKSRMVNVLHDNTQSLLIQSRQPQSVSRLYIHFQLCPERHVLL